MVKKPDLEYPCRWRYTIVGSDREGMERAVACIISGKPHILTLSRKSEKGTYCSLRLETTVDSEAHRLKIYEALRDHPLVRVVL
ncbi:MAG: DUF493 domain-containing protein [Deltaproteobacteria bacterium]|nr:DUF493 domain-containing protein [Deltaproteobacteria bacterium]